MSKALVTLASKFSSQQKELITSSAAARAEMALCPLQHHSQATVAGSEMMQQKSNNVAKRPRPSYPVG